MTGRALAEWWRRALAYLLDGVVLLLPMYLLQYFVLFSIIGSVHLPSDCTGPNPPGSCGQRILHIVLSDVLPRVGIVVALYFVVTACYYTFTIAATRGQTLGMAALGIAVRDEHSDETLGVGRAFVRWLVVFALSLPAGIPAFIDFLAPLWDRAARPGTTTPSARSSCSSARSEG